MADFFCEGGWRSPIEAAIMRGLGVTPGAPDLPIVADGRAYFLELKAPRDRFRSSSKTARFRNSAKTARLRNSAKTARISAAQHECHQALRNAGATVAVADNIDQAFELLESWQILRPNPSNQLSKAFIEVTT